MTNSISQRISLEGAEEIRKQLEELGIAGEKVFAQIREATKSTTASDSGTAKFAGFVDDIRAKFVPVTAAGKEFGNTIGELGNHLGELGRKGAEVAAVFGLGVTASFIGLVETFKEITIGSAEAAASVLRQSQALGLTIETYQKLRFAAGEAGISQDQFATAMARFSRAAEDGATTQRKTIAGLTESVLQSTSALGFASQRQFINFNELIKQIGPVAGQIAEQLKAAGINLPLDTITQALFNLARGSEAVRAQLRSLGTDVPAFTSLESLHKLADQNADSLKALNIPLLDLKGNARAPEAVLADLADKFKQLPDGIEKTALATKIFGRGVGPELVPMLNQGRSGLEHLFEEFAHLGIAFDLAQTKIGKEMVVAFEHLGTAAGGVKNQLGLIFAPLLTQAANSFREIILQNFGSIQEFGRELEAKARPALEGFLRVLAGAPDAGKDQWIVDMITRIKQWALAVGIGAGTVAATWRGLIRIFDEVATAINSVLGTSLSGTQIVIGAWVAKVLGLFSLVSAGIRVLTAGFRVLGAAATAAGAEAAAGLGAPIIASIATTLLRLAPLVAVLLAIKALYDETHSHAPVPSGDILKDQRGGLTVGQLRQKQFLEDSIADLQKMIGLDGALNDDERAAAVARIQELNERLDKLKEIQATNIPIAKIVSPEASGLKSALDAAEQASKNSSTTFQDEFKKAQDEVKAGFRALSAEVDKSLGQVDGSIDRTADKLKAASGIIFKTIEDAGNVIQNPFFTPLPRPRPQQQGGGGDVTGGEGGGEGADPEQFQGPVKAADRAADSIKASFATAAADMVASFDDARLQVTVAFSAIAESASVTANGITSAFSNAASTAAGAVAGAMAGVVASLQQVAATALQAASAVASVGSSSNGSSGNSGGGGDGFAAGGNVRGPGSGTSDSILAWLSNGEFVVRAAAVRHFGSDFFASLNNFRMPAFSLGGIADGLRSSMAVPFAIPSFAAGGLSSGGALSPVTIQFPGLPDIVGLGASSNAIGDLRRAAALAQVRSGGRKPSRYGGR